MNTASTFGTALLRGIYLAIGSGVLTALLVWATTDEWKPVIIAGGVSALTALGFRAGGEGIYDARRAAAVNQKSSDVGYVPPEPGV